MLSRRDFGLGLATLPFLHGQSRPRIDLRLDANLVLVPVSVADRYGHPVLGLEREHFRLFQNNVEQNISHFASEDEPVAVGLVFDVSGSMGAKLYRSRMAARAFFATAEAADEFFLIEFDSSPRLITPLTQDIGRILSHVALFTRSRGSTALVDAVVLGLNQLKKSSKPRKALLVISDGGENNSRYSNRELRTILREGDALVYAIGVYGQGGGTREELDGQGFLKWIAEQTGGRELPSTPRELPETAFAIGRELRNRYVLGFVPPNLRRDGQYHAVQVKVTPPRGFRGLRVFWRRGYYAPPE